MQIKVAPSILSCDFAHLHQELVKCHSAQVDMLHIDVMDGHFVPNITIGPIIIRAIRPYTKLPIEAHLMIENPEYYIKDYADAGADIVNVHAECFGKLKPASDGFGKFPKVVKLINEKEIITVLKKIKKLGAKPAVTLNPGTPLCVDKILDYLDMVLLMSVNPGFSGQRFMPDVLPKIKNLRKIFDKDIAVDGGINIETAPLVVSAGANILVTASYFFSAKNPKEAVRGLKSLRCGLK